MRDQSRITERRQTDQHLLRQSSLGTNEMPTESCLHSAAYADGCWYQRQRIVGLLRNACETGTMLRGNGAIGFSVMYHAGYNVYYRCAPSKCVVIPISLL